MQTLWQQPGKYFTKALLIEAAERGPEWDFNRQLDPAQLKSVPEVNYEVSAALPHTFRHGEPAEAHIRCVLEMPEDGIAIVDVPIDFYEALPEFSWLGGRVPTRRDPGQG